MTTQGVLFIVGMMVLFVSALAVFSALTISGRAGSEEEIDRLKRLIIAQSEEIVKLSKKVHILEVGHDDESSGPPMLSRKLTLWGE